MIIIICSSHQQVSEAAWETHVNGVPTLNAQHYIFVPHSITFTADNYSYPQNSNCLHLYLYIYYTRTHIGICKYVNTCGHTNRDSMFNDNAPNDATLSFEATMLLWRRNRETFEATMLPHFLLLSLSSHFFPFIFFLSFSSLSSFITRLFIFFY